MKETGQAGEHPSPDLPGELGVASCRLPGPSGAVAHRFERQGIHPLCSFISPFHCAATILNTTDWVGGVYSTSIV